MRVMGIRTVPNVVNGLTYMVSDVTPNHDPATGEVVGHIAASTKVDVEGAIDGCQDAFERSGWATASFEERANVISNIARAIHDRADEFAEIESGDTGKPLHVCKAMDIARAAHNFEFFAGYARHMPHSCQPVESGLHYTQTKPAGVVSLITPWNLPMYLLTWKLAPALMMGNACVAKPATNTPSSASLLAQVCLEAGLPPGLFNVVQGRGALAGDAMVKHPAVKCVSFTGGTDTGRDVAAAASAGFKKVSLELGGKNPVLVFGDVDVESVAQAAVRSAFLNSGQICLCGSRIFVERSIYDQFREAFVRHTQASLRHPSALHAPVPCQVARRASECGRATPRVLLPL
jgi:aminomuconate-semialdehyde/2-hydroxymuconate-6-semialdehyde dehydrogenase